MKYFLRKNKRDAFAFLKVKFALALLILVVSPLVSSAQNVLVKGVVTDEDNLPLLGATVFVDGTTIGTTTDLDGAYSLQVPSSASTVLSYSYIGYETVELAVNGRVEINVSLKSDSETLDEVIVVGYGVQKKESVVGAISQVDGESLVQSGTSNVSSAIAGRLSGVLTIQDSGQPGDNDATIYIRGVSSWNGSSPLCLVDGVERSFNDMDPNEIETFSVLKDASATAVFGAKGANGVIIVTTKRGKVGAPKLNVSVSQGLSTPSLDIGYVDGYTTMSMRNEGLMASGSYTELLSDEELDKYRNPTSILDEILYPDVDWVDLLTKDFASETNANFTLSGGTEAVQYFVSLGYTHEGSLFKTYEEEGLDTSFKNDKISYRTNFDFKLSPTTKLKFNVGGATNIYNAPTAADGSTGSYLWDAMYTQSSTKYPAFYPEELLELYPDTDYPDASGDRLILGPETRDSPYSYLMQAQSEQLTTSTLYTDLELNQDLSFITKGLSASAKISVNTSYKRESLIANKTIAQYTFDIDSYYAGENPWYREGATNNDIYTEPELNMSVGDLTSYSLNLYYEASLNYAREFGDHTVSALALFNRTQKQSGVDFPYYNESWVARATYDYKHKYLFEFNLGYTGSEKFAPTNRFGLFPSFAFGYVMSNEDWFRDNISWIDNLKLRYSDGHVGSDSGDRWLYVSEYLESSSMIYEGAAANLTAQWEESHKRDIGLELGFLDNALTFHFDFFDEQRTNMLVDPSGMVSDILGSNGFKEVNLGSMKKHGFEIEGEYRGSVKGLGIEYSARAMLGFNENRIIAKNDIAGLPEYQKVAGTAYGGKTGSVTTGTGYYTSIDDIHNYTTQTGVSLENLAPGSYRYIDYNGDGAIDSTYDTYSIYGSQYAPITYSFGGDIMYKNFTLTLLFQGTKGKYVSLSGSFVQEFNTDDWRVQENMLDYWTPTNQDASFHSIHAYNSSVDKLGSTEGYSWVKADYLKLRDVYFGYMFDTTALKESIGLSNMTIYVTGNNLFTFTNFIFGDPESTTYSTGGYPQMKTVKLGVKLGF